MLSGVIHQANDTLRPPAAAGAHEMPLHLKPVAGSLDVGKIEALPSSDPDIAAGFKHAVRWLDADERYADVPLRSAAQIPGTRLTTAHVQQMEKINFIREIDSHDVRGGVRVFTVAEHTKNRLRRISNTHDSNTVLIKDPTRPITMIGKPGIVNLVHAGTHMVSLDFAAWYDQFAYSDAVGSRFCFKQGGKCYALKSLAMGQRQAVEVAFSASKQIANFPMQSKRTEIVIDNIIFVGTREAVLADAREFGARCQTVGAQLNEDVSQIEKYCTQSGDWCGVHLDLVRKKVALTQKSVDRTALSWSLRGNWSWRGFATHMGLLFWSYGIIDVPLDRYFTLLSFLSRASTDLAEHPELWDAPAAITPAALQVMESWTSLVARNEPRHVPAVVEPEWMVFSDASRWGWGYVAIEAATMQVRSHGERWAPQMQAAHGERLGQSTFAEPHAVVNSLLHLIAPGAGVRRVRVATDNTATLYSFGRGFSSHALHLNQCISRLKELLPGVVVEMIFIPGKENPADGPSRGRPATEAEFESLRQVMGQQTTDSTSS